jgi:probable rRNA maturation factor
LGWAEAELSLTLVGDRAMARLNRETFGRRGPTNVIAFPMDAETGRGGSPAATIPNPLLPRPRQDNAGRPPATSGPAPMLGEVVISVATTVRQAQESGWPWQELLDFYLIHGILHLLGYDHEDPEAEARMDDKAWELMALLYPKLKKITD